MPVVKHGDECGQTWDPKASPHPIMPTNFDPFYETYIPFRCKGYPKLEKAAFAAMARRDQKAIEDVLSTVPYEGDK